MDDVVSRFRRNPDGSWTCLEYITLDGPKGRIQVPEGRTFARGYRYMGVDLAEWLDDKLLEITRPTTH